MSDTQRAGISDTTLVVRCRKSEVVFSSALAALRRRGYAVSRDPLIERDHKILSKFHRLVERKGNQGSLWISAEWYPVGFTLTGWQSVNYTNPHGGMYDFGKLKRMPYLIRLSWLKTLRIVGDVLARRGIAIAPPDPTWSADPLGAFNASWSPERFARDATGWPDDREVGQWKQIDADGVPLRSGEHRYVVSHDRHWWRVRVYGGINGMWIGVGGPTITNRHAGAYFSRLPADPRQRAVGATLAWQGLWKAFRAAIERRDYLRAAAVDRAAAARGIALRVSCEGGGGHVGEKGGA